MVPWTNGSVVTRIDGVKCQLKTTFHGGCKTLIRDGEEDGLEGRATKMVGTAMMNMFKKKAEASEDDISWKEEMEQTMAGPGTHCPPSHPQPTRFLIFEALFLIPSLRVCRDPQGRHVIGRESDLLPFHWLDFLALFAPILNENACGP